MKVTLYSYRPKQVVKEGETEVEEVELTSQEESFAYGKEKFITIKLDDKLGTVKLTELHSALRAFDDE